MRFILMALLVLISGCVSVKYNGSETKINLVDRPPIGQVVTVYVGDELLQKGAIVEEDVLKVNQTINGLAYDIPQGTYRQVGYDESNNYYSAVGVVRNALADPEKALMLGKAEGSELCVVTVFNAFSCYKGDYERKKRVSERDSSFQQTLIYSGRVGNKLKIGYREFSNNIARPAYSNEVEYDLDASNIIGYKGAQIEVIKADNTSITYKVKTSFP